MANGQMGRKISEATKARAMDLLRQGVSVIAVMARTSVSETLVRQWSKSVRLKEPKKESGDVGYDHS